MAIEEQILRPSRGPVMSFAGGALSAIWGLITNTPTPSWKGSLGIVIGGVLILVAAAAALPGAFYLRLDASGFTTAKFWRRKFVPWRNVSRFGVGYIYASTIPVSVVGFNYVPECGYRHVRGLVSTILCGFQDTLPDTYGMKAEELVALMTRCREEATQSSH